MQSTTSTNGSEGSARRSRARRQAQLPLETADRRKGERRQGEERRASQRITVE